MSDSWQVSVFWTIIVSRFAWRSFPRGGPFKGLFTSTKSLAHAGNMIYFGIWMKKSKEINIATNICIRKVLKNFCVCQWNSRDRERAQGRFPNIWEIARISNSSKSRSFVLENIVAKNRVIFSNVAAFSSLNYHTLIASIFYIFSHRWIFRNILNLHHTKVFFIENIPD